MKAETAYATLHRMTVLRCTCGASVYGTGEELLAAVEEHLAEAHGAQREEQRGSRRASPVTEPGRRKVPPSQAAEDRPITQPEGRPVFIRPLFIIVLLAIASFVLATSAQAATPVSKAQRELVIVSPDLSQGDAIERGLYDVIEWSAVGLATGTLGLRYNVVHVLKDGAATRGGFVAKLDELTAKTSLRAVDVIFITHGLDANVLFSNGAFTMASVRDRILANLTTGQRAKLRMLFSTACFGASHRLAWRAAGFNTVSGSRAVYADSAATYQPFLTSWLAGVNFGLSVTAANAAGATSPWDALASGWLLAKGSQFWDDVDSFRLTMGTTTLTIGTMP